MSRDAQRLIAPAEINGAVIFRFCFFFFSCSFPHSSSPTHLQHFALHSPLPTTHFRPLLSIIGPQSPYQVVALIQRPYRLLHHHFLRPTPLQSDWLLALSCLDSAAGEFLCPLFSGTSMYLAQTLDQSASSGFGLAGKRECVTTLRQNDGPKSLSL